jgi:hypothetical protein
MQSWAAFLLFNDLVSQRALRDMQRRTYNPSNAAVLFIEISLNNVSAREAHERFVLFHAIIVVAKVIAVKSGLYNSCANRNPNHFAVQQIPWSAA